MKHNWEVTPSEAVEIQKRLCNTTVLRDDLGSVETVAGVDVGFEKSSGFGRAAIAVLQLEGLSVTETSYAEMMLTFPYVPGLLSFREIPVIMEALAKLERRPDLLLCDGQGTAHPRRLGIACHLGLLSDIPSIGVAKTRLTGKHEPVPNIKGMWVELFDGDEVIGAVLRTRKDVKPVYVSPGHRISLESAIDYVMRCVTRYKLPETTRQAHRLSLFAKEEPKR